MGTRGCRLPQKASSTCVTRKLAIFISTGTGSLCRTPGGQHLLIYYAEPGSESAKAPEVLRGLAVTVTAEVEEELTRAPR